MQQTYSCVRKYAEYVKPQNYSLHFQLTKTFVMNLKPMIPVQTFFHRNFENNIDS